MERQELFCHNRKSYVRFNVPESDGEFIVRCPNCGHEHFRVVRDGVITEERWGSSNSVASPLSPVYATGTSTANTSFISSSGTSATTANSFIAQSWLNTSTQ